LEPDSGIDGELDAREASCSLSSNGGIDDDVGGGPAIGVDGTTIGNDDVGKGGSEGEGFEEMGATGVIGEGVEGSMRERISSRRTISRCLVARYSGVSQSSIKCEVEDSEPAFSTGI
jgi:hypothetical protein